MAKFKMGLCVVLLLCGCSVQPSKSKPVFGGEIIPPVGWVDPNIGWCKRNPEDIDCKKHCQKYPKDDFCKK